MQPYLTFNEYKNLGGELPEPEFDSAIRMASRDIDSLTLNRIVDRGFDNLTTFQQTIIKECLVYQIAYRNGLGSMIDFPISGYSAGGTSVQFANGALFEYQGIKTTTAIVEYLKQTGLMVQII